MKLDLLYEVDAPKPWSGPHPTAWMAVASDGSAEEAVASGIGMLPLSITRHLGHESIKRTIEILGKEIIPEIEAYTPKPSEIG